ncbi:response regulator transcription factor [Nonomuraea rhodomycinica]|uniref:Response regulator transcription factor n=1 Tax=Nonomuraea rhodomycinica TaxID=1712872 RepID=A0A7Y6IWM8_9ACTN|nr:response regulator transcription factor [Nonomuraea rhodomycinica]
MAYGTLVGVRVLLVEDERRLAGLVRDGLSGEGFAVDVAHDGRDGLWMATEHAYDVIVLDVMLPRMNGYTVCARLREAGNWTPIMMLTAKDGVYDEAEALDTGADDYLSKPFSYVVLLARLRALVRRGGRERPVSITVGDLVLDPAGLRCRRGEVEIALTPKEFAVLHGLARRPGEVVSKSELLAQAWDFAYDGDPNIVEVYISALRRKIDQPFGRSSLITVRGAGYRLEAT